MEGELSFLIIIQKHSPFTCPLNLHTVYVVALYACSARTILPYTDKMPNTIYSYSICQKRFPATSATIMPKQWLLSNEGVWDRAVTTYSFASTCLPQLCNAGYGGEETPSADLLISGKLQGYKKKSNYFPHRE